MFAHVYRVNESDTDGLHQSTSRVTVLEDGTHRFGIPGPTLVLGTLPNTTAMSMKDVRWFWVEED